MTAQPPDVEVDDVAAEPVGDSLTDIRAELAEAEAEAAEADALAHAARARARAPRRRQTAALVLAALLAGAGLALTGLMLWQHSRDAAQRAEDQRFVEGARAGVTALLSIDHTRAQADVQRVLDLSTGSFYDDFQRSADDFVKTSVDSKAVTIGKVNASALDSVDGDRGVVMVVATSQVTNANGADNDPRPFRMSVTVDCNQDPCKMSDVEFVP
jgi:Mce-associated membrane protein